MTLKELEYLKSKTTDAIGLKLIVRDIAKLTVAETKPREDWNRFCSMYDLKPEDFGKRFKIRSTVYEICGISPTRPKYSIQSKRVHDGKIFGVPAHTAKHGIAA